MSDQLQRTAIERAIARALRNRRITRRQFLVGSGRGALVSGAALSLPAILAACGIRPGGASPSASVAGTPVPLPSSPAGELVWANWPLYIDIDEETGGYPTIEKFQTEHGIQVTYQEDINDNEEFFATIQPDLEAGNSTGYDVVVLTDWMIERMARLGYIERLDHSQLPNFAANAFDDYKDPWFDPGNAFSVPWQGGITGIGYDPNLTEREITSIDDLFDPAFAGRVGMFSEMRDTMSLTLLSLGVNPEEATVEDAERARDKLLEAAERGQFRNFYGNEYYDELANGNLAITIAWAGDVTQMKLYDNDAVEFVVPEEGGVRWVDNMCIPRRAEHPLDAHMLMNFWYDVENATALTEYVGYFSPVEGVPERVLEDRQAALDEGDQEWADALEVIAETATPPDDVLDRLHTYRVLDEEEEQQWNDLFNEVVSG